MKLSENEKKLMEIAFIEGVISSSEVFGVSINGYPIDKKHLTTIINCLLEEKENKWEEVLGYAG